MSVGVSKTGSVLIVDDDDLSILVAEMALKKYYYTQSVNNGYDAINAVVRNHYDIILMDINLGDDTMDGILTMKLIKDLREFKNSKIFALTSYVVENNTYLELGFDAVFIKPIIKEEMINAIKYAICA